MHTIDQYIKIFKNIIPYEGCDSIIAHVNDWEKHTWYNHTEQKYITTPQDPSVSFINNKTPVHQTLSQILHDITKIYFERLDYEPHAVSLGNFRVNRYDSSDSQELHWHHDHIKSLFDGNKRGIPIFSYIMALNDDYEGGDLIFKLNGVNGEETVVSLTKGDIVVWPSLFIFYHCITPVTKGTRYSIVNWSY